MPELDASTLIAVGGFASVITGCLLLVVAWQYQASSAAVVWGIANLMAAVGLTLAAQGWHLDIAIACMIASTALTWVAAARFGGRTVRPELLVAGAVAWMAIGFTGEGFELSPPRLSFYLLLLAAYLAGAGYELWRGRAEVLRSRWPLLFLVGIHALFLVGGAVLALIVGGTPPAGAMIVAYLEVQVFAIGTAVFLVALIKERSEREHRTAASVDPLTGLPNRGTFIDAARTLLARSSASGQSAAAIMFDLDNFKRVNDSWGHRVGDTVIRRFADVAARSLRHDDLIGRIGGEEFAVLMPGAGPQAALAVADRIRSAFARETDLIDGSAVKATVSAGLAVHGAGTNAITFEDLLDRSDRALYVAKANGRNRIQLAPEERSGAAVVKYA